MILCSFFVLNIFLLCQVTKLPFHITEITFILFFYAFFKKCKVVLYILMVKRKCIFIHKWSVKIIGLIFFLKSQLKINIFFGLLWDIIFKLDKKNYIFFRYS